MVSEAERNPIYGLAWPLLLHGAYPLEADTWNLGMLLGLPPRADLLPFLLGFGAWTFVLVRSARAAGARR
jgi:hypothetical protein